VSVRLDGALGHHQHEADGVLGDGLEVPAGLVDGDHAGLRASLEVDRVVPRAVGGDDEEVGRALQESGRHAEWFGDVAPRGGQLVPVRIEERGLGDMTGIREA